MEGYACQYSMHIVRFTAKGKCYACYCRIYFILRYYRTKTSRVHDPPLLNKGPFQTMSGTGCWKQVLIFLLAPHTGCWHCIECWYCMKFFMKPKGEEKISCALNTFVLSCFHKIWTIDFRSILLSDPQVISILYLTPSTTLPPHIFFYC
jgi:hypothetical protein